MKVKMKKALCGFFALAAAVGLLLYPTAIKESVLHSIFYCLTALVPSLFPFMAVSAYLVRAGIGSGAAAERTLGWLTRKLFRLPAACAAAILMSFLGGYPTGAKSAALLLEQGEIDEEQAGRMLLFCVNPGVAFVVTFLGGTVLGNFRTGWLLFAAVTLSGVVIGIVSGFFGRKRPDQTAGVVNHSFKDTSNALTHAISDASSGVVTMCACIVLFSGITALLHSTGVFQLLSLALSRLGLLTPMESSATLSFLWEVTGGVGAAQTLRVSPVFYAFGLAFGGLCVHLQVFSFFSALPCKKLRFFCFRLLHGLLAAGIYHALFLLLPTAARETFLSFGEISNVSALSGTAAGGLSLLCMCTAFLLVTGKQAEPKRVANPAKSIYNKGIKAKR